jgi:alkylation response protein AidB-like acyl-CoA dehydrogenase
VNFEHSDKVKALVTKLQEFMDRHIYPAEAEEYAWNHAAANLWKSWPGLDPLKAKARAEGLWNLFLPHEYGAFSPGLTNLEYAPLAEIMGRVPWSSEVFNCSAPDTGNMETLHRYGSEAQKKHWLVPLLRGEIRSSFAMTEPEVASSDATNIATTIKRDGNDYVVNGRKWYTTGATDPRCQILIVMGKTNPNAVNRHEQQSMILVPKATSGVKVVRALPVLGYYAVPDRAAEVWLDDVRVPVENILLGEGRGFEIAQGRLGPGRIHHCMRLIGLAERVLERMCRRTTLRVSFGRALADQTVTLERIAEARIEIEQARLLTLKAAWMMDHVGNKQARQEIAMIKVAAPLMAQKIIDWAIQAFGGGGTNDDHFLGAAFATARLLRLADGPDEVHRNQIGRLELKRYEGTDPAKTGGTAAVLSRSEALYVGANNRWPAVGSGAVSPGDGT